MFDTWDALIEFYQETFEPRSKKKQEWIFRGHRDAGWNLETTLERAVKTFEIKTKDIPKIEGGLLRRFKRQYHHSEKTEPRNIMEWLALMQHYGAPTRLLDWTFSFFVALYFAVEDADSECAVWALDSTWVKRRVKRILPTNARMISGDDPNATEDDSFKKAFVRGKPISFVCHMNPYNLHERLVIQQGIFLCPGDISKPFENNLTALLLSERDFGSCLVKLTIGDKPRLRKEILQKLHRMNMNRATLFPGLDGFGQSLRTLLVFPDMLKADSDWLKRS